MGPSSCESTVEGVETSALAPTKRLFGLARVAGVLVCNGIDQVNLGHEKDGNCNSSDNFGFFRLGDFGGDGGFWHGRRRGGWRKSAGQLCRQKRNGNRLRGCGSGLTRPDGLREKLNIAKTLCLDMIHLTETICPVAARDGLMHVKVPLGVSCHMLAHRNNRPR